MTALEFLKTYPYRRFLCSKEGDKLHVPSNSELKRWLLKGSVIINGVKPKPQDTIAFPIEELVFFEGAKAGTCTMVMTDKAWEKRK